MRLENYNDYLLGYIQVEDMLNFVILIECNLFNWHIKNIFGLFVNL